MRYSVSIGSAINAPSPIPCCTSSRPGGRPAQGAAARAGGALPARARNRRFGPFCALLANTKTSYETNLLWRTLGALNRPGGPGPSCRLWICAPRLGSHLRVTA
jgi:hypothetical protein